MANIIADLLVRVSADISKLDKGLATASSRLTDVGQSMMSTGAKMTAGLTVPLVAAGVAMVDAASDMEESVNKVNVVFGKSADRVQEWSKTTAKGLGQSRQQALEAAGTFGNLFSSMGLGIDTSTEMSLGLVELASDLASFNNIDPTVALEKLRSGLVGETEPLRALGVNLSAAAVKAKAMEMGLALSAEALTPAALAQARYALILEQTTNAQGDFARTSDGLANSTRIAKAEFADAAAKLGVQLLPIALKIVTVVSDLVDRFSNLSPAVQQVILVVGGILAVAGPIVTAIGAVISVIGALSGAFSAVAGVIGTVVGALALPLAPILAIAAAIALLYLAWKNNWLGIQDLVTQAGYLIEAVINFLKETLGNFIAFVTGQITFEQFVANTLSAWGDVQDAASEIWPNIQAIITGAWETIKTTVVDALVSIVASVTGDHEQARQIITTAWTNIQAFLATVWTYIKELAITIWTALVQGIQALLGLLAGIITAILQAIAGDWAGAWETIKTTTINFLSQAKQAGIELISGLASAILGILDALAGGVYEKGAAMVSRWGDGIKAAANRVLDTVRSIVNSIRSLMPGSDAKEGPLKDLYAAGQALPKRFGEGIASAMGAAINPVESFASHMAAAMAPTNVGSYAARQAQQQGSALGTGITINIYNPTGEPAEESIVRQLKYLAGLGIIQPIGAAS